MKKVQANHVQQVHVQKQAAHVQQPLLELIQHLNTQVVQRVHALKMAAHVHTKQQQVDNMYQVHLMDSKL